MSNEIIKAPDTDTAKTTTTSERSDLYRVRPHWKSSRDETAYHLQVDLPGVDKSAVRLRQEKNLLILEADRDATENHLELIDGQRVADGYKLLIKLPKNVDSKKIQGKLNNGCLSVVLPIRTDELPREIPLN